MVINVSYQLSPALRESLQKIEAYRRQILLAPLPPKTEMHLRWEAMVNRLYWSLALTDKPASKKEALWLLTKQYKNKLTSEQKEVFGYKKALDYVTQEWLVSPKTVTPKTILALHDLASCPGRLRVSEATLKPILEYLQVNPENPIIQGAIAQIEIFELSPFTDGNGRVARLLALLFLYKYGYDFRGLLTLEEYFRKDLTGFTKHTQTFMQTGNVTPWLEYFAKAAETQLEKASTTVASPRFDLALSTSFFELNDRQKEILTLLDEPNSTITNKKVQKNFRISQITASRDLAKLASLGLLFPHGKGRSVRYTKA